jgi:acylphosphatase
MDRIRVAVQIHGIVQGVGFRYFTRRTAQSLGLSGWVRNLPDGTVEAVLEGPRTDVETSLAALRQGPAGSRVDRLKIDHQDYQGDVEAFEVRF